MLGVFKFFYMTENNKFFIDFQPGIFTLLTYDLLSIADKGGSIPTREFMKMCDDYTIMNWLRENTSMYKLWDDDTKIILAEEFCALANCVIPEETFGVASNGVLVLIAFCQELINHKPSRTRIDCKSAEKELKKLELI